MKILNTCAGYSSAVLELGRKRVSSQSPTLNASIDSKQTPGTVARVPQMHHNCHVIWSSRVPRAHANRWMYVNIFACVGRISRAQEDRAWRRFFMAAAFISHRIDFVVPAEPVDRDSRADLTCCWVNPFALRARARSRQTWRNFPSEPPPTYASDSARTCEIPAVWSRFFLHLPFSTCSSIMKRRDDI